MLPENHQLLLRTRIQFGLGVLILVLMAVLLTRQCNRIEREELRHLQSIVETHGQDRFIMDRLSDSIQTVLELSQTLDSLTGAYPKTNTRVARQEIRSQFRRVESQMMLAIMEMQWIFKRELEDQHPMFADVIDETIRLQIIQMAHAFASADFADTNKESTDIIGLQTQLHKVRLELLEAQRSLSECSSDADKVEIARQRKQLSKEASTLHLYGSVERLIDYMRVRGAADEGLSAQEAAEVERRLQVLLNSKRSKP